MSQKSDNGDVTKCKNEMYQTYQNYLQEADAFNSYLRGVVANTSRYVPEDQIWPMKQSCGSQDSGVIFGSSVDTPQENVDKGFIDIEVEIENEEGDNEEVEHDHQFAKCREGIRLFREGSVINRSPPPPDQDLRECSINKEKLKTEEGLSELKNIMDVMAKTRLDDQRCQLGINKSSKSKNLYPQPPQINKKSDFLDIIHQVSETLQNFS